MNKLHFPVTRLLRILVVASLVLEARCFGLPVLPALTRFRGSTSTTRGSNYFHHNCHIVALSENVAFRSHHSHLCLRAQPKNEDEASINNASSSDSSSPFTGELILLLISQFILFIGVGAVIPTIPLYGKEIGLSSSLNGVVISAPAVALLIGSRWGGEYADRARKPAMMIGMAVIAVSDLGTAFANDLISLVIARLGLGAGRCVSEAGERGMLADMNAKMPQFRGRALAAQQTAIALGIAIGAPIGGIVTEKYGPRASFLCVTAAALSALTLYAFLPETVGAATNNKKEEEDMTAAIEAEMIAPAEAAVSVVASKEASTDGDWGKLLSSNQWRGLAICQCGASFGFACKIATIPVLASQVLPGGAAGAGALLSAAGLSGILGAFFGGWLTDRSTAKFTAIVSGIVSASGLFLVPFALGLSSADFPILIHLPLAGDTAIDGVAFVALVITWSLGASAQGPALTAFAQQLAPAGAEATSMALPRAAGDGTYIVAPFLLGLVTDSVLTAPGTECAVAGAATFLGVVALALLANNSLETNALAEQSDDFIKLVSIDVERDAVHNLLRQCGEENPDIANFLDTARDSSTDTGNGIFPGEQFVKNTHITMAHCSQLEQNVMHDMFDALKGSFVGVKVTGFMWSDSVAAFSVTVQSEISDEKKLRIPSPVNDFPHVTVWHRKGSESFLSNELPGMVENGTARRIIFESTRLLDGTLSFWANDKTSSN